MDFCVCIISDLLLIQRFFIYCCLWFESGWLETGGRAIEEEIMRISFALSLSKAFYVPRPLLNLWKTPPDQNQHPNANKQMANYTWKWLQKYNNHTLM